MGLVVDTSALVAVERGAGSLPQPGSDEIVALPAIILAELLVGVRMADTVDRAVARQRKVASLLEWVAVVPFDRFVAERWADLFAHLRRTGTLIPSNDLVSPPQRCIWTSASSWVPVAKGISGGSRSCGSRCSGTAEAGSIR